MNWLKQKTGSFIFIATWCFITLSCSEKTKPLSSEKTESSGTEDVREAFISSIEIPNEVTDNEIISVKINYMLFNACWSYYNVERIWEKDTLHLKVNIQKHEDGMCPQVIINDDKEFQFKIREKGNYFIKYLNTENKEVFLPLKVK